MPPRKHVAKVQLFFGLEYENQVFLHKNLEVWNKNTIFEPKNSDLSSWLEAKRPYYIITAMLYLCDAVHPSNKLREDISQLMEEYAHLPVQRMGFFDGWDQEPIWAIGKG